jgi:hypothetical protein
MKIKEGDMITEGGISYAVENIDGTLWGVSNNAEYEIELSEDFVPDAHFSLVPARRIEHIETHMKIISTEKYHDRFC